MGMQEYETAVELMNQYPQHQDFMGPRDENLIRKAEEILGLRYPPIYRRFLLEYGAGGFFGFEVYGITTRAISNGVWYTLQLRERFNSAQRSRSCIQ